MQLYVDCKVIYPNSSFTSPPSFITLLQLCKRDLIIVPSNNLFNVFFFFTQVIATEINNGNLLFEYIFAWFFSRYEHFVLYL